jgi:hypothetical protein
MCGIPIVVIVEVNLHKVTINETNVNILIKTYAPISVDESLYGKRSLVPVVIVAYNILTTLWTSTIAKEKLKSMN